MRTVVDTETAKVFMKEILEVVDVEDLAAICRDVEAKAAWYQRTLSRSALPQLSPADYEKAIVGIFAGRRKAKEIFEQFPLDDMRDRIARLLYGEDDTQTRFQEFVDGLGALPEETRIGLAGELLHFTDPERHWLWTVWMWNPRTNTGSLPLLTSAAYDLDGETLGEVYMKVGKALAFVHETGNAADFRRIGHSVFGTDVFLCAVYVIYAYTVLRMRMTQEFNKVMPQLPEFCRRLLGVRKPAAAGTV